MRFNAIDGRAAELAAKFELGGDPDELLSDDQLTALIGVTRQWVIKARRRGNAPPSVLLSPRVRRTKRSDFVRWVRARMDAGHARA